MSNHYIKLGLSEDASPKEIKAAFKKLAVKYHPDKNAGDQNAEEQFKAINEAYQVLSNPYEKARYDIKLQYGEPSVPPEYEYTPPRPGRREYAEAPVDYKQNWIATAYAFGFTLVVAMIIMTGIWINNIIEARELAEILAARRVEFEEAKSSHQSGDFAATLSILNNMGGFHTTENDIEVYKAEVVNEVVSKGERAFDEHEYQEAIFFFEVLEKHAPKEIVTRREKLAISYKEAHQPEKSIQAFEQLLAIGFKHISTYIQLAEIHRDQLSDFETSKHYFELASSYAIKYYRAAYGDAFAVMLDSKYIPEIHFQLYTGLADIYLRNTDYEMAINATDWNIQMWPDSAENYIIAARSYEEMNNDNRACELYEQAFRIDRSRTVPFLCR